MNTMTRHPSSLGPRVFGRILFAATCLSASTAALSIAEGRFTCLRENAFMLKFDLKNCASADSISDRSEPQGASMTCAALTAMAREVLSELGALEGAIGCELSESSTMLLNVQILAPLSCSRNDPRAVSSDWQDVYKIWDKGGSRRARIVRAALEFLTARFIRVIPEDDGPSESFTLLEANVLLPQ